MALAKFPNRVYCVVEAGTDRVGEISVVMPGLVGGRGGRPYDERQMSRTCSRNAALDDYSNCYDEALL
jgi:hypothetical protein